MPEIFDEKETAVTRTFMTVPPAARLRYKREQRYALAWRATTSEAKVCRRAARLLHRRLAQGRHPRFHGAEADRRGERGRRFSRRYSKERRCESGRGPAWCTCRSR